MSIPEASLRFIRTAAPLYRDVAEAQERALREGVWKPGDQIPTEPELEKRFGASRGTLRIAISELVRKGLLHRQSGRGTFVLGPEYRTLTRFFRYERRDQPHAIVPEPTALESRTEPADARTAEVLRIEPGTAVGFVRRLRRHKGEPFQLLDSYFTPEAWAKVSKADFGIHPLYDDLKDKHDLFMLRADEFLRADLASEEEARHLEIAPRSPVMRLERIAYTFEDQPIEYRRSAARTDHFHYHVSLQ